MAKVFVAVYVYHGCIQDVAAFSTELEAEVYKAGLMEGSDEHGYDEDDDDGVYEVEIDSMIRASFSDSGLRAEVKARLSARDSG